MAPIQKLLTTLTTAAHTCLPLLLAVFSANAYSSEQSVKRLTEFNVIRSINDHYDKNQMAQSVTLPDSWHEKQNPPFRNSWYSAKINVADVRKPFAVYIPRVSMNVSVTVNGKEIGSGGQFTEPISRNHGRPLLFVAPAWLLQGDTVADLTIRVSDNLWGLGYLGPVYVGDLSTLTNMYHVREFWQVHLTLALALLMVIFSVVSFTLYAIRGKETHYVWFGLAMLLFAVDTFNVFVTNIPVERRAWEIYSQTIVYAFAVATIVFIHRFTQVGWKFVEPILGIILVIKLVTLLLVDVRDLFVIASIFNLVVISYGALLAVMVVRSYIKTSRYETGVTALAGLILLAVASHTWLVQFGIFNPENLHIIHYGAPCFFLLISFSLARKFLASLDSAEALARELDMRVQQKEKELAATYEELNILNQRRTLSEERSRIMREVHDGFGAHLVGAMTMLETQKVDHKELSDYLKTSLLDLRIMIDSLDPDVHEVSIALGMLRSRVEPILKNRNITLDWKMGTLPDDLALNPNKTLSLLRVMQELITNILKHSSTNHVAVVAKLENYQEQRILLIDLYENGSGFDPNNNTGRGMRNIHNRIKDLDGKISYRRENNGFKTTITVPGFPMV